MKFAFTSLLLSFNFSFAASPNFGTDYVDVSEYSGVASEIRYATSNNFVGENLYGDFNKPYLHQIAAEKLKVASANLQKSKPGWKLLIFDALRPRSIQKKLWDHVKGTNKSPYVANPDKGSVHNYGFAVDLSLQDENGKEIDMGTAFDSFEALAQPKLEDQFLKEGKLKPEQIENRKILRKAMTDAGFIQLPIEWWHFDALPAKELKKNYKIVE